MVSLTLKCYKSFQNENNRKVTHSFAPRRLIWPFLNLGLELELELELDLELILQTSLFRVP